jgi:hypothetical protein
MPSEDKKKRPAAGRGCERAGKALVVTEELTVNGEPDGKEVPRISVRTPWEQIIPTDPHVPPRENRYDFPTETQEIHLKKTEGGGGVGRCTS